MTNKNTFRFATFAAVASLGLGLMISGCGDGGSTTPNPLNAKFGQVTFNYNVLAQTTARADIAENIVSVKYIFFGVENGARFMTEPVTHNFIHGENDAIDDVTVKNVSLDASGVIAAYYDKDGQLVAMGEDEIEFDTEGKEVVETPEVTDLANATYSMTASQYVIAPKDETVIGLTAVAGDKTYNVTPFVTIEGINEAVLAYVQDTNQGATYQGAEYGTIEANTIKATVNGTAYTIDKPIYVTDQTPNAIEIEADQIDGKDVTITPVRDSEDAGLTGVEGEDTTPVTGYGRIILAGKDSILANEKAVELTAETQSLYYAVNKQPIAVYATGYTEDEGKGPTPKDVKVKIDDASKITLDSANTDIASTDGLNVIAAAEGGTVIGAYYKVDDETTVKCSNFLEFSVGKATENLAFATEDGFMTDVKVDAENDQTFTMAVAGKASLTIGDITYVSAPIEYTDDKYPAIVPVSAEGIDYAQTEGKNEYTLTVTKDAVPEGDVEITVADTTPAFESIKVLPNQK